MGEEATCVPFRPFAEYKKFGAPCFSKRHDLLYLPMSGGPGDRHYALGVVTPFGAHRGRFQHGPRELAIIPLGQPPQDSGASWCAVDDETGILYISDFDVVQELQGFLLSDDGLSMQHLGALAIGRQTFEKGQAVFRSAREEGEHWTDCPCDGPRPSVCDEPQPVGGGRPTLALCDINPRLIDRDRSSNLYAVQGGAVTPSHTLYLATTNQKKGTVNYAALGLDEENSYLFYSGVLFAVDLRTGALRSHLGTRLFLEGLQAELPIIGTDTQQPEIEGLTYWRSPPGFPGQLHVVIALNEFAPIGYDNYSMLHLAAKDELGL